MSEAGQLIRAQDLEPGAMVEVEGDGYRSLAKVQAVRDKVRGIEIDLFLRNPMQIPAGHASVNYWTLLVPFDTRVRVSHLPSQHAQATRHSHASGHQQGRHS